MGLETTAELTETDQETWTLYTFTDPRPGHELTFDVWKLVKNGVTVAGASPEQARNRLAAKLGEGT